ncbi:Traf2 And Nck-Interacting Protein Kinase [Manis pentadactyla]|nr:Traf2 And Nck-Interacting Protein Kinase [Manis pentadactyla]
MATLFEPTPSASTSVMPHRKPEASPPAIALYIRVRTPKPNPRPDPWTRYFTFNIDINNDSFNPLTFDLKTCPDIRIAPESVHNHIFRIDFSLKPAQ